MTLTIKEPSLLDNVTKPGATAGISGGNSDPTTRSNPVCLEVAVTIRSLPGEKSESSPGPGTPTREETRTVIVFDNGAVLRLGGNFPPGQAVILSNPQGRDVVCRVISARNLPTVKGYIEVEFLEPIVDFWGIHKTPGEANVSPAPVVIVSQPQPGATPAWNAPDAAAQPQTALIEPAPWTPPSSARSEPSMPEKTRPTGNAPSFEDVAGVVRMSPPPIARGKVSESPSRVAVSGNAEESTNNIKSNSPASARTSSSDSDANSLPAAWEATSAPGPRISASNDVLGKFSGSNTPTPSSSPSESRGKTPLIVAGAAVFLIGLGSGLFFMHRGSEPASSTVPSAAVSQPVAPASPAPSSVTAPPVIDRASAEALATSPALSPVSASPKERVVEETPSAPQTARHQASNMDAMQSDRMDARQPERPAQRPQIAHDLKMSAPTPESRSGRLVDGSIPEVDGAIATSAVNGTPGGLLATVSHPNNPPAPPVPSGAISSAKNSDDPRLISSTRPIYPPLAKQANVEGDVLIAVDIDATGKVVGAKATSGPMFLRQPAIDAVREWKYIPATNNGRPASAQITVKIQFRLK